MQQTARDRTTEVLTMRSWRPTTRRYTADPATNVQYRPRYASATNAPTSGARKTVPAQLVTLFAASTVPWCSLVVRYITRFDATP
jgi:hypothetical protein